MDFSQKINFSKTRDRSLNGKVAMILGASSGIGKQCALSLADSGCKIMIIARREKLLQKLSDDINHKYPDSCFYRVCDVTILSDLEDAISLCAKKFNKIDIAVNNFGICNRQSILDLEESNYDNIMNTNVKALAFAIKYEVRQMIKQLDSNSSIINIGSILSLRGRSELVSYCASKHAVVGITKAVAAEGLKNIRVNCICPGWIIDPEKHGETYNPAQIDTINKFYPIGRLGNLKDVANLVIFLASNDSSFINGSSISLDGGATSM